MNIYKCVCADDDSGTSISWHASRAKAERALRKQQTNRGHAASGPEGISAIEIPTKKADLLHWLNTNFTMDNG